MSQKAHISSTASERAVPRMSSHSELASQCIRCSCVNRRYPSRDDKLNTLRERMPSLGQKADDGLLSARGVPYNASLCQDAPHPRKPEIQFQLV